MAGWKKKYVTFAVAFGVVFGFNLSLYAKTQAEIYALAASGKKAKLIQLKEDGKNLDELDDKGRTALCQAVEENNQEAYNILKEVGADYDHKCLNAIPGDKYSAFLGSLEEETSFWSSWKPYAISALAAVGVIAGSSGGGGGGGSSDIPGGGY